jgi:hypothetical protein
MSRPEDQLGVESECSAAVTPGPGEMDDPDLFDHGPDAVSPDANSGKAARGSADAQAVRTAQARIDKAIDSIRSLSDPQFYALVSHLPPPSLPSPSLPPPTDSPNESPTPSAPRHDSDSAGIKSLSSFAAEPDLAPTRHDNMRRGLIARPLLARFALMAGFAALVAYGITISPSFQNRNGSTISSKDGSGSVARVSHEATNDRPLIRPRLVVENQRAFANEPILLGVAVTPSIGYASLSLAGLAQGTRLSAGAAVSEDSWEVPFLDAGSVYVYAPKDFIGAMNPVIALLSSNKEIIADQPMRLEWVAKASPLQPQAGQIIGPDNGTAVRKEEIGAGATSENAKPAIDSGTVSVALKPMDPQLAEALMGRGRDLLRNGDIALAQLAFRRLAEAGNAEAALALATTFDPRYLAEHKLVGVVGDEEEARTWYRRARELGTADTDHIAQRAEKE